MRTPEATTPSSSAGRAGLPLGLVLVAGLLTSGCAAPVIGALTVADMMTGASVTSTILTGRSTNEHLASLALQQDCRFLDAALSEDRDICEQPGAYVTEDDFRGLLGLFDSREIQVAAVGEGPWTQVTGEPFPSVPTLARALDRLEADTVSLAALPAPAYPLPGSAPLAPVQVAELAQPAASPAAEADQLAAIAPAAGTSKETNRPVGPLVAAPVLPRAKPPLIETARVQAPVLPMAKPEGIGPLTVKVAVLPAPRPEIAPRPAPRPQVVADGRGETVPGSALQPVIVQWRTVNGRRVGQPVKVSHQVAPPRRPGPFDI